MSSLSEITEDSKGYNTKIVCASVQMFSFLFLRIPQLSKHYGFSIADLDDHLCSLELYNCDSKVPSLPLTYVCPSLARDNGLFEVTREAHFLSL